jgi:hypothetical protein
MLIMLIMLMHDYWDRVVSASIPSASNGTGTGCIIIIIIILISPTFRHRHRASPLQ